MAIQLTDEQIDRENIAHVLGVESRSLDTWKATVTAVENAPDHSAIGKEWTLLGYEGAPEWLDSDLDFDATYVTVVRDSIGNFGATIPSAFQDDFEWLLVGTYAHGAERECGFVGCEGAETVTADHCVEGRDVCAFCEASIGEAHGYVYIGEGYEAVYVKLDARERLMRQATDLEEGRRPRSTEAALETIWGHGLADDDYGSVTEAPGEHYMLVDCWIGVTFPSGGLPHVTEYDSPEEARRHFDAIVSEIQTEMGEDE